VLTARLATFKMETEDDFDATRWLDRTLIRLSSRYCPTATMGHAVALPIACTSLHVIGPLWTFVMPQDTCLDPPTLPSACLAAVCSVNTASG